MLKLSFSRFTVPLIFGLLIFFEFKIFAKFLLVVIQEKFHGQFWFFLRWQWSSISQKHDEHGKHDHKKRKRCEHIKQYFHLKQLYLAGICLHNCNHQYCRLQETDDPKRKKMDLEQELACGYSLAIKNGWKFPQCDHRIGKTARHRKRFYSINKRCDSVIVILQ